MKDIAKRLKMSVSTVSRALKDHPDISEETKSKVKALAKHLDYVPHLIASQLRSGDSRIIALVVPKLSIYFYYSVINAVEEWASEAGYNLMIFQTLNNVENEDAILKRCRNLPVVGIMIALADSSRSLDIMHTLRSQNIPIVFYDRVPLTKTFDRVYFDGDGAAELATTKLLAERPERVEFLLGSQSLSITEPRQRGCENALSTFRFNPKKVGFHYLESEDEAELAANEILKSDMATSIFCMSDELIVGVMRSAQKLGKVNGVDFRIIGISNGIIPSYFHPNVNFIETNGYDLGREAIRRLFQLMKGDPFVIDVRVPYRYVEERWSRARLICL